MKKFRKVYQEKIGNLGMFLRNYKEDTLVIRTTYVEGGWHGVEFDARKAGFGVKRDWLTAEELATVPGTFSEIYVFTRK